MAEHWLLFIWNLSIMWCSPLELISPIRLSWSPLFGPNHICTKFCPLASFVNFANEHLAMKTRDKRISWSSESFDQKDIHKRTGHARGAPEALHGSYKTSCDLNSEVSFYTMEKGGDRTKDVHEPSWFSIEWVNQRQQKWEFTYKGG